MKGQPAFAFRLPPLVQLVHFCFVLTSLKYPKFNCSIAVRQNYHISSSQTIRNFRIGSYHRYGNNVINFPRIFQTQWQTKFKRYNKTNGYSTINESVTQTVVYSRKSDIGTPNGKRRRKHDAAATVVGYRVRDER